MNRRVGAWLTASLALALPASADATTKQAFDPLRSVASFKVAMRLPLRVEGRFNRAEGELASLPDGFLRVHARLDGRQLRMIGPDWMQRVTLSDDFLDVRQHPDIRFDSQEIQPGSLMTGGALRGRLQLRGQVREVLFTLLPSACARPGHDCAIRVLGQLDRHDFGMHAHRFSVRDEITFDFSIRLAGTAP